MDTPRLGGASDSQSKNMHKYVGTRADTFSTLDPMLISTPQSIDHQEMQTDSDRIQFQT